MHPALLTLGNFTLETYNVVWLIALSLAMVWSVRRFQLYGVDDAEARRVIAWSFFAMLLGARAFEYIWNFPVYLERPSLILDLRRGGLSEVGAFTGAFLAALSLSWRNPRLSFQRLCDVVSPPAISTLVVGRWGCFFNGCCAGIAAKTPWAVHFPFDPAGVTRHPTQLYYSAASLIILCLLLLTERRLLKRGRPKSSILTPLGLILYGLMRFAVDPLRFDGTTEGMVFSHRVLLAALPLEGLWLLKSLMLWKKGDIDPPSDLERPL